MNTLINKNNVSSKRIAEILRQARGLMNNNGRHWVQGDEKVEIAPNEYAFCSIGSILEVTGGRNEEYETACLELAKIMSPESFEEAKADWEYDKQAGWGRDEFNVLSYVEPEELIIDANDDGYTTWNDVKNWFTKAADRAAKRKN